MAFRGDDGIRRWGLEFADRTQALPMLRLLTAERAEFEAVLGGPVEIVSDASGFDRRWVIESPPVSGSRPILAWEPETGTVRSTAANSAEFAVTLNLLHTLARSTSNVVTAEPEADFGRAFDRIDAEIAGTYPSFALRGLDWARITDHHSYVRDLAGDAFRVGAQQWIAQLGDAHTSVRRPGSVFHPPYAAVLTGSGVRLLDVPRGTAAHAAGVGAGWTIPVEDPAHWVATTGATAQQHARVAARRYLAMSEGERGFTARDPVGVEVGWVERLTAATVESTVTATRLDDHRLYVRLSAIPRSVDLPAAFDELLAQSHSSDGLVLDLRGNTGGALATATNLRDRFLRRRTHLGNIQFSTGRGELAEPVLMHAEPSSSTRWNGHLTVLVDAMTYSAAEDFLLGLQGLDHVTVHGERTGGGSGRPRTMAITEDLALSVSTALTYDRTGRCIEANGIPVDGPVTHDDEPPR